MSGPLEQSSNGSSSWTAEHHLVGKKVEQNLLISAVEFDQPDSYVISNESIEAQSFQPENVRERKPALWRSSVERAERPSLAIDLVSSDWQQQHQTPPLPPKHIQDVMTERLNGLILDHIYEKILPQLVLKAALEEVRSHFMRTALSDNISGSRRSSKASQPDVQIPPLYYAKHPNSYLKAPERTEKEPSTASVVEFTPSNILNRIKAGCALAWSEIEPTRRPLLNESIASDRRASSRIARIVEEKEKQDQPKEDTRYFWGVITGGTIASFLLDTVLRQSEIIPDTSTQISKETAAVASEAGDLEKGKSDDAIEDHRPNLTTGQTLNETNEGEEGNTLSNSDPDEQKRRIDLKEQTIESNGEDEVDSSDAHNPYLPLSEYGLLEWLGKKTAKLLSVSDLQRVFPSLMLRNYGKKKKKTEYHGLSGLVARPLLSSVDKQLWEKVVSPFPFDEELSARLVLESMAHDDVSNIDQWETAYFARASFSLRIVDDGPERGPKIGKPIDNFKEIEKEYKERKTWEILRFKGIHSGFTVWPSWITSVNEWKEKELAGKDDSVMDEMNDNANNDLDMAKAIASEEEPNSRRRKTRRGGETSGVFYGNQSGLTLKQLMETLLRLVSQKSLKTLPELLQKVPDESTDPLRRMRNALGRLVWKRKQMSQLPVNTQWTDSSLPETVFSYDFPKSNEKEVHASDDLRELLLYIVDMRKTELQLRRIICSLLTSLPVSLIASAGDDRPGTMEASDQESFTELESIQWKTDGHDLIGKNIYRPSVDYNIDSNAPCQMFKIQGFTPSVLLDPGEGETTQEKPSIGIGKENRAVECRARFLARSCSGDKAPVSLVLTESQVFAGIKAAEIHTSSDVSDRVEDHQFAGNAMAKVTLVPCSSSESEKQINGEVVGWDSNIDEEGHLEQKILVLPGNGDSPSFWASLSGAEQGTLLCKIDGGDDDFTVQQFDYHSSSRAFKECREIIGHLQRHSKANPFLEPVDPVTLGIPNYFDVIKNPMDIRTVSEKLERGEYSNLHPKDSLGRTPVSRMLNGPFRKDIELIFDNAIAFNPPDDWIYQAAVSLKKYIAKKIDQASSSADESISGRRRPNTSAYIDYDSDVDMYMYESDRDDDYEESRPSRKRKDSRAGWSGEDTASKAIERPVKLQKVLGDSQGLRAPLSQFPINSNSSTFSLPSDWNCERSSSSRGNSNTEDHATNDLGELVSRRSQVEEKQFSGLRRSTRSAIEPHDTKGGRDMQSPDLTFVHHLLDKLDDIESPKNRAEVEIVRERLHEEFFAKVYHTHYNDIMSALEAKMGSENHQSSTGLFSDDCFPPFLGRVTPVSFPSYKGDVTWEIRTSNMVPALRWVLRGLVASGHFSEIEPMASDSVQSGVLIPNNFYYIDTRMVPFDVLHQREIQRRKKANQEESGEDEEAIELSEYEKRRAERVARNQDRLKILGLA